MKTNWRTQSWQWGRLVLAFGLVLAVITPGWSDEEPKPREQQITDLQKQVDALQKQITDLKKDTPASKPGGPIGALPDSWASSLQWRSIGPASMGGRITALSVFEADPTTYWVATASGGLLKTVNNGTTFEHQFDKETTVSIGDVCVAPSNKDIVWVGSGEANPRNSVSYGDGVYKSTDGGKKWTNMGLKQSYQTGRIAIHPKDPNIVYVGVLGRLYGPNPERGVFKTIDGGKTWEKVLYFDENTGCIDLRMHPTEPNTLWAALWERKRDGHDSYVGGTPPDGYDGYDPSMKYGTHAGLYKSTDGGKNWSKLTKGLPNCKTGRVGLDVYLKNPNVLFAIIDSEKIGTGPPRLPEPYLGVQGENATDGNAEVKITAVVENSPAAKAKLKVGDIVTAMDGKKLAGNEKWLEDINDKKVGDKVKLAVKRGDETLELEIALEVRPAGRGPGGRGAPEAAPAETPYMGVQGEDAPGGAKLTAITENSPAARAGLKTDDLVTAMDGKPVTAFEKFADDFSAKKIGDKVKLTVKRGEETKEIEVALEGRTEASASGGRGGANAPGSRVRPYGFMYAGQSPNVQKQQGPDGEHTGGIYKSTDGGESWTRINSLNPRPMYFSVIRVDPSDEQRLYVLGISFYSSADGGKTFRVDAGNRGVHADHHALWIDPKDGRHMIIGTDGGMYATYDRMAHWDHLTLAALGQFYHVCVDNRKPYRVIGGLQDNGSWSGPSRTLRNSGPVNEEWFTVSGGDGFVCRVDPDDPDVVYTESQGGVIGRRNLRTGERGAVRARAPGAPAGGGRGTPTGGAAQPAPTNPPGGSVPANTPTATVGDPRPNQSAADASGQRGGTGGQRGGFGQRSPYNFNWNTPFILSAHNPRIVYVGGNFVFRSLKQGEDLKIISPEIVRTKRGTATALAESPRNPDILWAGTDDGNLWISRDGGQKWTNIADKVGLPGPRWVSTIEASRFSEGRAYVCFDAHRSDDDKPYCYVTEDYGQTWKSITNNLPAFGSSRCLREDVLNGNLLFCGSEFACFASTNRGMTWTKINNNLPTVAIHELAIHPTAGEMVAATHGRSLWVLDISALRQVKQDSLEAAAHLYAPTAAIKWRTEPEVGSMYGNGSKKYFGQNPPAGTNIYVSFAKKPEKASLKVYDVSGQLIRELAIKNEVGFQRINWNLTRPSAERALGAIGGTVDPEQAMRRPGGLFGTSVPPGQYRIVLSADGKEFVQALSVEADPVTGNRQIAAGGGEDEDEEEREGDEENERMRRLLDK